MIKRKEDAMKQACQQTPGITYAKKPKLMELAVDGTIDLQRVRLPSPSATSYRPLSRQIPVARFVDHCQ